MLEFQKESHATTPQVSDPPQQLQEQEAKIEVHDESQEECNNVLDSNSMEKPSLLEAVLMETAAVDGGDDDGSKTPTSLDHRISITKCPPAPRKPKPFPI
ncbi:hypothetical protein OIU77_030068 [Salix suchowensis]|uniref:Uncharacterized protein n=1 Tax=Salix suchowensis TaxID=1278906 RepID=A0ABQ9BCG8_9ROSI|nr:hypothetical protein OIU77_030068 [Salix suchowensis]